MKLETHELPMYSWMSWMKNEKISLSDIILIFRIVLGYSTLRRSEMVGNIVTPPDISYMGAEHRDYVNCA